MRISKRMTKGKSRDWNVREGLTQEGQWYLDRTAGKVVYWPLPGEDMAAVKSVAPTVESILRIRGQDGKPVRDVTIRGLTLGVTNTPLVAGGFGAGKFPGAVELTHAEKCRIVDLQIKNVAGQGIRAWNLKSCVIEDCHVHDTGGYGASAYYLDEQAEDCLVEDNLSVRVARPSHNHMARKNTLRNNVFICDGDATLTFPRSSEHRLERNVVVAGGAIRITRPEAISDSVGNIACSKSDNVEGVHLKAYQQTGTKPIGSGNGWQRIDPKLVEYESGKVRFAADSPVDELGIQAIDVSRAGCVKD